MPGERFTNVGVTYVAGTLPPSATTLNVTPGSGSVLPVLGTGEFFTLVLTSPGTGNIEVVRCTARVGDTLTIERAREPVWGQPPQALQFEDGDEVRNSPSAEWYARVAFESQLNTESARVDAAIAQEINDRTAGDTALDGAKADKTDVAAALVAEDAKLAGKADITYVDAEVAEAKSQNTTTLDTKADKADVDARLDTLRVAVNENTYARWNPGLTPAEGCFPPGTVMLFHNSNAPPSWTKLSTFSNHALTLTAGSISSRTTVDTNGVDAAGRRYPRNHSFTDMFARGRHTQNHRLTTGEIPQHTHQAGGLTISGGVHKHLQGTGTFTGSNPEQGTNGKVDRPNGVLSRPHGVGADRVAQYYTETDGEHTHDVGGVTGRQAAAGASLSAPIHRHLIDMDVNYASVIMARKDAVTILNVARPSSPAGAFVVY